MQEDRTFFSRRILQLAPLGAILTTTVMGEEFKISTVKMVGKLYTRVEHPKDVLHYEGNLSCDAAASLAFDHLFVCSEQPASQILN